MRQAHQNEKSEQTVHVVLGSKPRTPAVLHMELAATYFIKDYMMIFKIHER